jgi:hypothetical protein
MLLIALVEVFSTPFPPQILGRAMREGYVEIRPGMTDSEVVNLIPGGAFSSGTYFFNKGDGEVRWRDPDSGHLVVVYFERGMVESKMVKHRWVEWLKHELTPP